MPGFVSILGLSVLYAGYHDSTIVQGIFYGIKPAIIAIVIQAVIRIGKRSIKNSMMFAISTAAFVSIYFLQVPFPWIVLIAGIIGYCGGRIWPEKFVVIKGHGPQSSAESAPTTANEFNLFEQPRRARSLRVFSIWLAIWFLPVIGLIVFTGRASVYSEQAMFFSKAAVVTFGGAYSVLAYVAQEAVATHRWLQPGEMLDGMGMAESISVVYFADRFWRSVRALDRSGASSRPPMVNDRLRSTVDNRYGADRAVSL